MKNDCLTLHIFTHKTHIERLVGGQHHHDGNKEDKILLLESADNQSVDKMCVNKQVEIKEI